MSPGGGVEGALCRPLLPPLRPRQPLLLRASQTPRIWEPQSQADRSSPDTRKVHSLLYSSKRQRCGSGFALILVGWIQVVKKGPHKKKKNEEMYRIAVLDVLF